MIFEPEKSHLFELTEIFGSQCEWAFFQHVGLILPVFFCKDIVLKLNRNACGSLKMWEVVWQIFYCN